MWHSFISLMKQGLKVVIDYFQLIGLVIFDLVGLIALFITIFSFYRISSFRILKKLCKQSDLRNIQTISRSNTTGRKKKNQQTRNEAPQENYVQNRIDRGALEKGFLGRARLRCLMNLNVARKCCILIMLDFLVLPFALMHLVNLNNPNQERNIKLRKLWRIKENPKSMEEYYDAEKDIIYLRFIYGREILLTFFKIILILVTVYKITKLFTAFYRGISFLYRSKREESSLTKEIDDIFRDCSDNCIKILSGIVIFLCVVRIKSTLQRLQAHRRYLTARLKRIEVEKRRFEEGSEVHWISLNDMTWDVHGRICQYLTITDLARLCQVNRKLRQLTRKDYYWECQYNRDWKQYGNQTKTSSSFRQKCVDASKEKRKTANKCEIKPTLTEKERDRLCGSVYIMLEEAIISIKTIPWVLLVPANILDCLLLKIFKPVRGNEHYLYPRSQHMIDNVRLTIVPRLNKDSLKTLTPTWKNFHSLHLDLERWFLLAYYKYISEILYLLSYIGYMIIKTTSAGGYNPMIVEYHPDTDTITARPGEVQVNEIKNATWRFILYFMQFILTCVYIAFIICVLIFPNTIAAGICMKSHWDLAYTTLLFILSSLHGVILVEVVSTNRKVVEYSAPYFKPLQVFRISRNYLRNAWKGIINNLKSLLQ